MRADGPFGLAEATSAHISTGGAITNKDGVVLSKRPLRRGLQFAIAITVANAQVEILPEWRPGEKAIVFFLRDVEIHIDTAAVKRDVQFAPPCTVINSFDRR